MRTTLSRYQHVLGRKILEEDAVVRKINKETE